MAALVLTVSVAPDLVGDVEELFCGFAKLLDAEKKILAYRIHQPEPKPKRMRARGPYSPEEES